MRPIGPEPSVVYWVRRGAIFLVALTVLVVLWWLVAGRGSGEAAPEPAASASVTAVPTSSTSPAATAATPTESTSLAPGEVVACDDAAIKVDATTDATTYRVGETPKLTLTIQNTGSMPCTRDVGPKANTLEITSGGYHVWSSDDCATDGKSKVVTLDPKEKFAATISWGGRQSQPGCPSQGAVAKAGRYEVVGKNGNVESDPTPFALTSKKA